MGTTADKLTYLNNTKVLLKDRLNSLGATITSSTTFRNYLTWLDTFYGEVGDKTYMSTNGLEGETYQETTTGKNLLTLASIYNKTQYGISGTYNTDGSYTISGKGTQSGNAQITQNTPLVLDAGTYTFSIDHALSKKIYLHIKLSDNSYKNISLEAGETSVTDTLSLASTEYNFRYVIATDEVVNETIKMQLESGSTPTTFEKFTYGASPNPSYPQPINNLTGNVAYKVSGKNLIDFAHPDALSPTVTTYDFTNDIATISGTGTYIFARWIITDLYKSNAGKTLKSVVSGLDVSQFDSDSLSIIQLSIYYNDGTPTQYLSMLTKDGTTYERQIANDTSNVDHVWIHLYSNNSNRSTTSTTKFIKPMIIFTTSSETPYEPYIEPKTVTIPLGDIELAEIGTYKDRIFRLKGINLFDKDNANIVHLMKNANANTFVSIDSLSSVYIEIKPNTTYTVSKTLSSRFALYTSINMPKVSGEITNYVNGNNESVLTITSGVNDKYLCVYFYNSIYDTLTEDTIKNSIMINEGNTALPYEPYGEKGSFYLEKQIGKYVYNNDLTNNGITENYISMLTPVLNIGASIASLENKAFCNMLPLTIVNNTGLNGTTSSNKIRVQLSSYYATTYDEAKSICSNKNLTIYYQLETQTTTEITSSNYPELYAALKEIEDYLVAYKINKEFILGYSSPTIDY